ncbi:MAG: undecaprenyl-diphosphate phosphatase [Nitriliruptoraceae bacterium]
MIAAAPDWVQALVLGVVQGLTEFIPVSSSAHLVLVPALAGWERHGLAFDVALHLGTLAALLIYYREDLWGMLRAVTSRTPSAERTTYRNLVLLLIIASVPVAVAGLTLEGAVEALFSSPRSTAWLLFVTAAVLVGGERLHRRNRTDTPAESAPQVGLRHALIVGFAQAFALLPGLTRSGLTISAGVAVGLPRPTATRFAFLLGIPAIAGAAVVQLPQVSDLGTISLLEAGVGVVAAAVSGYAAITMLVRLVSRAGIDRFAWYVVPLAIVSLIVLG